ncbi:MAG: VrrA/YqfQ family protein [Solibacillus sp.]|uniref:VrrA/YqfQ family protein n=1 Tax=unclassified Solibacillus TaxID=2637870 RepID=UPI0030FB8040
MRPPFYVPPSVPGFMMNQMPIPPRFPMYAPQFMRAAPQFMRAAPFVSQMPIPPQVPMQVAQAAGAAQAAQAVGAAGAAGVAGAAAGAPRLESLLAGANSLFTNAQKYTPYIQQAAPMFKNLPALWRLYRGFKDTPDPLESSTAIAPEATTTPSNKERNRRPNRSRQQETQTPKLTQRPSKPMIFQPPFNE